MANPLGMALRKLNLYHPMRRAVRRMTDADQRKREDEVRADLAVTRAAIGSWAREGTERAKGDKTFAVLSFTDLPLHLKFQSMIAKIMQLEGYTPLVFTFSGVMFAPDYFELFGIERENVIYWNRFSREIAPDDAALAHVIDQLLPANPTTADIMAVNFHGAEIGKHALSMTARKLIQGRLDLADPQVMHLFRANFKRAAQSVIAMRHLLDTHPAPIQKMLVRDAGYVPNGAIYETALERGVDCIVYEQGQRRGTWILKRYTPATKGQHYFSLADSTWEHVKQSEWKAADDAKLNQIFVGRYTANSTDDTRRLQTDKQVKSPEEVRAQLGLDPTKKTAVIFSHIAWDAAFFFGSCLFDDFEHWLFETVKYAAANCPDMNWIVKLHPFNVFKLQREGVSEESEMKLLRALMPLPDHVKIMRANTDINTQSLFPLVDYVLTVNGTVGMEFPCYGVPALLGGTGRYNGRGFTIEPQTRDEYFAAMRTLHTIPKLDRETQNRARRYFYTLTARRQTDLEDIAPMELKRMNEAQSDVSDNIHIKARSLAEFEGAGSIKRLRMWLAHSDALDILEPVGDDE